MGHIGGSSSPGIDNLPEKPCSEARCSEGDSYLGSPPAAEIDVLLCMYGCGAAFVLLRMMCMMSDSGSIWADAGAWINQGFV